MTGMGVLIIQNKTKQNKQTQKGGGGLSRGTSICIMEVPPPPTYNASVVKLCMHDEQFLSGVVNLFNGIKFYFIKRNRVQRWVAADSCTNAHQSFDHIHRLAGRTRQEDNYYDKQFLEA